LNTWFLVVRLTFKYYVACDIKITPTLVLHIQIKKKNNKKQQNKPTQNQILKISHIKKDSE